MRCEELRAAAARLEVLGAEAEEHVRDCEACFSWLEGHDPLTEALRAARPPEVQAPAALAGEVVTLWRATALLPAPGRALLGLGSAAFAAAACAASIVALMALAGSRLGQLGGLVAGGLGSLLAPVSEVARFAAGQLLDHPAWLLGLGVVAALAGWGWARIDVELAATMRETA